MSDSERPPSASKSLVLVVGAGASYEVGLPLGSELTGKIVELLNFGTRQGKDDRQPLHRAMFNIAKSSNAGFDETHDRLREVASRICNAMPLAQSIDNFLDAHRDDTLITQVGKLAIARSILQAEKSSTMFVNLDNVYSKMDAERLKGTWYSKFFARLIENCTFKDLAARFEQVAIVCFNYDRCIQHYLFNALQVYYQIDKEQAADALLHLEIHHPYGTVGPLPRAPALQYIDFGAEPSGDQLVALANAIRTFTEGSSEQTSAIVRIRELLAFAERIAFLGFAFHQLNIELLFAPVDGGSPTLDLRTPPVFATGIGISRSDARVIKNELNRLGRISPVSIHIAHDVSCAKLFEEFRLSLSLR